MLRELARLPRDPRPGLRRRSTRRPRASGTGQAVWRSGDLGETWAHSSEGIGYGEDDPRKVSKVSDARGQDGRVLVGVEAPGIFESRDGGETWSLLTTLAGQPGSEEWDDPANQPPGHLGISAIIARRPRAGALLGDRAGDRRVRDRRRRHDVDAAEPRAARRLAARARGGRLLRAQARPLARRPEPDVPAEPRAACTAATTPATRGRRSPTGCRPSSGSPRRRTRTTATPST